MKEGENQAWDMHWQKRETIETTLFVDASKKMDGVTGRRGGGKKIDGYWSCGAAAMPRHYSPDSGSTRTLATRQKKYLFFLSDAAGIQGTVRVFLGRARAGASTEAGGWIPRCFSVALGQERKKVNMDTGHDHSSLSHPQQLMIALIIGPGLIINCFLSY